MLDAAEYLHLAIHASNEGNHHAALNHLKDALEIEPHNAQALYFLAAEHAELGLYDRACNGMKAALEVEPGLDVARFQLGLLCLQTQQPGEADKAFAWLASNSSAPDISKFAAGYQKIIASEVPEALALLRAGIEICDNGALKADMLRVIASLSEDPVTEPSEHSDSPAVFLGAYRDATEGH